METLNKRKNVHVAWAWLVVVIVGAILAFYWFSVRPEQIRKECYLETRDGYSFYSDCLKRHGLNNAL